MIQLLKLEWKTALKGWLFASLVIFPFTFIPVFFDQGGLIENIVLRIPASLAYATGFALFIVVAAIYQNYERQTKKINYFNKPGFKNLGFSYINTGRGSIVEDLSFQLAGKYNGNSYLVNISIDLEESGKDMVLITPTHALHPLSQSKLKQMIGKEFRWSLINNQLTIVIPVAELNLENSDSILKTLALVDAAVKKSTV